MKALLLALFVLACTALASGQGGFHGQLMQLKNQKSSSFHAQQLPNAFQQVRAAHTEYVRGKKFILEGTPEECAAAFGALQATTERAECKTVWDLFDATSVTLEEAQSTVEDYCSTNCAQELEDNLHTTFEACKEYLNVTQQRQLRVWAGFAKVPCLQAGEPAHYCLPIWKNLAVMSDGEDITWTEELLDNTYCDECVQDVFKLLAFYFPRDLLAHSALIDLICDKYNGQYSVLIFQDFVDYSEANPTPDGEMPSSTTLDKVCHPGVKRFITKTFLLMSVLDPNNPELDEIGSFHKIIDLMCEKDGNTYCLNKLAPMGGLIEGGLLDPCAPFETVIADKANAPACPADCKSALRSMKDSLGCCLGTMKNLMAITNDNDISVEDWDWGFNQWCGVSIPRSCSGKVLKIQLLIHGVDAAWYGDNSNKDAFRAALIEALKEETAGRDIDVSEGDAGAMHLQGDDTPIVFTVEMTAPEDNGAELRSKLESDNYALAGLNSEVPLDAFADLAQPLTASGSVELVVVGAASSIAPAASLLALLLAVLGRFI